MAYDYKIRTAPTASGGTAVTTWFAQFRVPNLYQTGPRRNGAHIVPYRDGYFQPDVNEYFNGPSLIVDGFLKRSTSASTGVGADRHIMRNYDGWVNAINQPGSTLWLGFDHPSFGLIERRVRPAAPPVTMDAPWRIQTVFTCIDAFWREEADSTGNSGTFTVGGTAPVGDAKLTWTGSTGTVTHTASGDVLTVTATPTGGIIFNMDTRTVTNVSGGTPFTDYTVNAPHWLRLNPGSNTLTPSAGVTIKYDYYPKHR